MDIKALIFGTVWTGGGAAAELASTVFLDWLSNDFTDWQKLKRKMALTAFLAASAYWRSHVKLLQLPPMLAGAIDDAKAIGAGQVVIPVSQDTPTAKAVEAAYPTEIK